MSAVVPQRVRWQPRAEPLVCEAALLTKREALALVEQGLPEELRWLSLGGEVLVLGRDEDLPWRPGVRYFGRDPLAATLLLPTHSAPSIPVDLLERCVRLHYDFQGPLLVDPKVERVIGVPAARPLTKLQRKRFLLGSTP